jgi:methylenetetrahydrofolate dehydrogenase (NADP+)/methenyltetrahydrofolate cyclohydrolase
MQILDGRATSQKILDRLKIELDQSVSKPNLDIILVGDDPASKKYVEMKQLRASSIGIGGKIHSLDQNITTEDLLELTSQLNSDPNVTAYMIQLPLPPQIDTKKVLESIDPSKDADGLTATNLGHLFHQDKNAVAAATSLGVILLLEEYGIEMDGKNVVQIGRSEEIGMPLIALLMARNATVTVCHSHTKNLSSICKNADILISSTGKAKLINKDFIKEGAVLVDVGLSLDAETNKLVGDVDFDDVKTLVSFITPVPGGVGPMTIASLLSNTVEIWKRSNL